MNTKIEKAKAFFHVIRNRLAQRGWGWFCAGLIRRCLLECLWLILFPLGLLGHLLGYRRLYVQTWHIGHLAADIDTFLKERSLGLLPSRRRFIAAPLERVANDHLLGYWRPWIPVVSNPWAAFFLEILSRRWIMFEDLSRYVSGYFGTQDIYRINRLWGDRPPVLKLNEDDETWGQNMLEKLGLRKGQWFVCVHAREGSYLPKNEAIQGHRNANILNTVPAMREIVKRGGFCIRMGDPGMTPLPPIPGVVDYAHHPLRSARMDVFLCAAARFFLGCTSGLSFLSTVFGVPVAQANMIPVETLGIRACDVSMPKLLWDLSLKRYLRFDEIMNAEAGGYFFTHQYRQANLRVDENSPQEILDLATEMLDRIAGCFQETAEDLSLHEKYMAYFKPGHYSYGANSRICIGFLRRHRDLLEDSPA